MLSAVGHFVLCATQSLSQRMEKWTLLTASPPLALYRPCSSPLCLLCLLHRSLSNIPILLLYSSETFLRRQCKRNLAIIALSVDCNMTMFQYRKSFQDFHSNLVDFRVFCISYCSQMYFVFCICDVQTWAAFFCNFTILELLWYLRGAEALIAWLELEEGHAFSTVTSFSSCFGNWKENIRLIF